MKIRGSTFWRAILPVQRRGRGVRFRGEDGNALIEIAL